MQSSGWYERALPVLDFETTGVDPFECRPVSVAALWVSPEGKIVREMGLISAVINPEIPIPEEATAVHGITDKRAQKDGWDRAKVIEMLRKFIGWVQRRGLPLVIYNAGFDWPLLMSEAERFEVQIPEVSIADPRLLDRHLDQYRKGGRRLETVAAFYGVPLDDAHEAVADCVASVQVLREIMRKYPQVGRMVPRDLHHFQETVAWPKFRDGLNAWYRKKGIEGKDVEGPWIPEVPVSGCREPHMRPK